MEYLAGDTIKLVAEFQDFDSAYVDPDRILLSIYDVAGNRMESKIVGTEYKISVGVYEIPYTLPRNMERIVYEFSGIINDYPTIVRELIKIKFYWDEEWLWGIYL